jgi:hypothetical protein
MALIINPSNSSSSSSDASKITVSPSNSDAETGNTDNWILVEDGGGGTRAFGVDSTQRFNGDYSFKIGAGGQSVGYGTLAQPVAPGQTYRVKFAYRSDQVWASGLYVRLQERGSKPVGGYVTYLANLSSDRSGIYDFISNGNITTPNTWIVTSFIYTPSAGTYWASPAIYAFGAPSTASLWFELLEFSAVTGQSPRPPKVTNFTNSATFTRDLSSTHAIVEMVGGGGTGGYGFGTATNNSAYVGIGGGSGAYAKVMLTAAQMGAIQTVTVGASGGASSFGSLATANGGVSGGGQYANSDLSLTSAMATPIQIRATFSISAGTDLGSKLGNLPSNAFVSSAAGKCYVQTSDGADSEMGRGARGLKSGLSGQSLNAPGSFLAQAAGANTGGGASGDATYTTTVGAGLPSSTAAGGTGFVRVTEYYV